MSYDGLSVSSNGSNSLQLTEGKYLELVGKAAFSILERIELSATSISMVGGSGGGSFSILERIELSATRHKLESRHLDCAFQYPRTDRTLCNVGRGGAPGGDRAAFSILV